MQASIHCPPQFPAPPYLQVLTLFLPHRHFRHVVSFLQLRGIQCSFYIPYLRLLFFSFPCFSCTVNFTVTVIATSTHSSSFPSPLPSHLLIVTPQLSPCPLTPSLSHFPFNTCQLLPARLSIEHHKKVTSLFLCFSPPCPCVIGVRWKL